MIQLLLNRKSLKMKSNQFILTKQILFPFQWLSTCHLLPLFLLKHSKKKSKEEKVSFPNSFYLLSLQILKNLSLKSMKKTSLKNINKIRRMIIEWLGNWQEIKGRTKYENTLKRRREEHGTRRSITTAGRKWQMQDYGSKADLSPRNKHMEF